MVLAANHSTRVTIGDREYLYFGGTNYVGMAQRRELIEAADEAFNNYGFSSGASRLTSGENELLLSLEQELAQFLGSDSAVVLPAGFMSNQVVVNAIDSAVDVWVVGNQPHASIQAALKQSDKRVVTADWQRPSGEPLRKRFGLAPQSVLGVFVEPIDSMVGTIADVAAIRAGLDDNDFLILDEAHSIGAIGTTGGGAVEELKLTQSGRLIRTGTFSKALGAYGGFVVANGDTIDLVKQGSSAYKGSTSLPPPVCAAARAALRILRAEPQKTVAALHANIKWMNERLQQLSIEGFAPSRTPIFYLPNSPATAKVREQLRPRGIYIPTLTGYFGAACEIGLRWTLQAGHTHEQMQTLGDLIAGK